MKVRNSSCIVLLLLSLVWSETRAGTLSGSFAAVANGSNVNLSANGVIDWVHWGLFSETSVDRKDGVMPKISDFTLLDATNGYAYVYQYADNANGYSWNDGTPNLIVTNTTTGVWAYGVPAIGSGFEIKVPAGTNARTLKVFVGAYAAQGRFEASLSDASAPDYVESSLSNIRNGPGRVYTLDYAANSTGQTLRVRWTLLTTRGQDANVTLQAATLSAPGANNPPMVMLTNPVPYASFAAPATINIAARASDSDGSVTNVTFYSNGVKIGETSVSPWAVSWANVPVGHYYLSAVAADNAGETSTSPEVEVFVHGAGGSLNGAVATPLTAVDLTTEGSADWVHRGLLSPDIEDRKSGVIPKISSVAALGTNAIQTLADYYSAFSWSDGTPTPVANGTRSGIFVYGVTNGFRFTAPADTGSRRLKAYVGCYGSKASIQAFLSDNSAPPFIDTVSLSNRFGNDYAVVTLDYAAATAGQTLTFIIQTATVYDMDFGNVTFAAASLEGGSTAPQPVTIVNSVNIGTNFVFSFDTVAGHTYSVEFTPTLSPPGWQAFKTINGTGGAVTITNTINTSASGFYRVITQ